MENMPKVTKTGSGKLHIKMETLCTHNTVYAGNNGETKCALCHAVLCEQAIHHLNCEIKNLEMRLDDAKELLHKVYRDLNQLNNQSIADDISKYLNDDK